MGMRFPFRVMEIKLQQEAGVKGNPGNQDVMSQVSKRVKNFGLGSKGEDEERIQFSV